MTTNLTAEAPIAPKLDPDVRSVHSVAFDAEDHTYRFVCENNQAACHFYPECDCEYWEDSHEHQEVWHGLCWMATWFEAGGVEYVGDGAVDGEQGMEPPASHTGTVTTSFEVDYLEWEWADRV